MVASPIPLLTVTLAQQLPDPTQHQPHHFGPGSGCKDAKDAKDANVAKDAGSRLLFWPLLHHYT